MSGMPCCIATVHHREQSEFMELIEFVELHHSSFNSINPTNSSNPMFFASSAVNSYKRVSDGL